MYPHQHLFFGLAFSLVLLFLFPQIGLIAFLLVFLSSILIDLDHYLYYIYKKKDLSLKNAYNWYVRMKKKFFTLPLTQKNKSYGGFCFLHGVEVLVILFLVSLISKYFLFVFVGFAFHLLLDLVEGTTYCDRIDKFSLLYDFKKFKKLKLLD